PTTTRPSSSVAVVTVRPPPAQIPTPESSTAVSSYTPTGRVVGSAAQTSSAPTAVVALAGAASPTVVRATAASRAVPRGRAGCRRMVWAPGRVLRRFASGAD